jgi:hypothetical protein
VTTIIVRHRKSDFLRLGLHAALRRPALRWATIALAVVVSVIRQSSSSELLLKWGGARSLYRNRSAIYVAASALNYVILPRHSFASDQEYAAAWKDLQRLKPSGRVGQQSAA